MSRRWILLGVVAVAAGWIAWRRAAPPPPSPRPAIALVGPHEGRVSAILGGDPVVSGDVHGRVVIWSAAGAPVESWVAHDGAIRRIQRVGADLLTVGGDGSAARWGKDGRVIWRRRHPEALNDGVLIDDALVVATVRGTVARLGPQGTVWQTRGAHGQTAFAVVAGDDAVFTAGDDGRIVERALADGKERQSWQASVHWIGALARQGDALIFGDGAGQMGRQGAGGFALRPAIKGPVVSLAVGPGGVALGGESGSVAVGERVIATGDPVLSLAWRQGALLSGGGSDGAIRIWRVKDGAELGRLPADTARPPKESP